MSTITIRLLNFFVICLIFIFNARGQKLIQIKGSDKFKFSSSKLVVDKSGEFVFSFFGKYLYKFKIENDVLSVVDSISYYESSVSNVVIIKSMVAISDTLLAVLMPNMANRIIIIDFLNFDLKRVNTLSLTDENFINGFLRTDVYAVKYFNIRKDTIFFEQQGFPSFLITEGKCKFFPEKTKIDIYNYKVYKFTHSQKNLDYRKGIVPYKGEVPLYIHADKLYYKNKIVNLRTNRSIEVKTNLDVDERYMYFENGLLFYGSNGLYYLKFF